MMRESDFRARLRASRFLILLDLGALAGFFAADAFGHIYLTKTLYLLAYAWLSLYLRGLGWRDLGFRLGEGWPRRVLIGLAAGAAMSALELFVTQPLLVRLTGEWPDLSVFRPLIGNMQLLLLLVAGVWTVAAIGEELVYRGWLLNRLLDLFGRGRAGFAAAILVMSAVFAMAHEYQGITGIAENCIAGLLLGGLYLATGRNLLAPIIAHGLTDTIDVSLIYAGLYPGM
jgi:membrane protease YdiL (CAAX protease family)